MADAGAFSVLGVAIVWPSVGAGWIAGADEGNCEGAKRAPSFHEVRELRATVSRAISNFSRAREFSENALPKPSGPTID